MITEKAIPKRAESFQVLIPQETSIKLCRHNRVKTINTHTGLEIECCACGDILETHDWE